MKVLEGPGRLSPAMEARLLARREATLTNQEDADDMAKKKADAKKAEKRKEHPAPRAGTEDEPQGVLVPMSPDELMAAGRKLAGLNRELRAMKTTHAGARSQMKKEREDLQKEIDRVAGSIAQQGR